MPLSGEALNQQGDATAKKTAPTLGAEWITIGSTEKTVTVETEAAEKTRILKKTAHGLLSGDIIVFTELNGKTGFGEVSAGLVIGAPYYARKVNANEIEVAYTKAQSESATVGEHIEFTAAVKTTTAMAKVLEHTGAKTKRIKAVYGTCANLVSEDATAREIEATGAVTVVWLLWFSAETAGTFMGLEAVASKTLAAEDLYKVTNSKLLQNAYLQ